MKTVIHVWAQKHKTINKCPNWVGNYGLGDLLRGSIGLYRYCKKHGHNFIVDFSLHPISSCLKVKEHPFSEIVKARNDNIVALLDKDIDAFIKRKLSKNDHVLLATNCWLNQFNIPADPELKVFIKNLFDFTDEFSQYVSSHMESIPLNPYKIIHVRLGDDALIHNQQSNRQQEYINTICSIKTDNSILLTDSNELKNAAKVSGIFMFNDKLSHLGSSKDIDGITHTLFEFILLTRASHIESFTVYFWTSGFAKIANFIYDVPLQAHVTPEIRRKK
jgi:hypothetical protein